MIQLDIWSRSRWKKIRLRLHTKTSDSLQLRHRNQGRTQGVVGVNPPPWAWYFTKTLLSAQRRL